MESRSNVLTSIAATKLSDIPDDPGEMRSYKCADGPELSQSEAEVGNFRARYQPFRHTSVSFVQ